MRNLRNLTAQEYTDELRRREKTKRSKRKVRRIAAMLAEDTLNRRRGIIGSVGGREVHAGTLQSAGDCASDVTRKYIEVVSDPSFRNTRTCRRCPRMTKPGEQMCDDCFVRYA